MNQNDKMGDWIRKGIKWEVQQIKFVLVTVIIKVLKIEFLTLPIQIVSLFSFARNKTKQNK